QAAPRGAVRALRARERTAGRRDRLLRDPRALQDRDRPRRWIRTLRQGRRRQPEGGGVRRRRARHGAEGGRAGPDDEPAPMKDLFDLTDRVAVVTGGGP